MEYIIDSKNRVGVVTERRDGNVAHGEPEGVFARPGNVPYTIHYPFAGMGNVGKNAVLITATWWEKQPDGTYRGEWYDETDNFHSAKDYNPPEIPAGVISLHKCLRCNHVWYPKSGTEPRVCPKCKSPYWNRPRNALVLH